MLTEEGSLLTTLFLLSLLMGRIEFPTTPIGAVVTDGASPITQSSERASFIQPTLEGLEPEHTPEIELGNCVVTSSVTFRKRVKGNEWHCHVHAEPDLLHPEQEGDFEAHATNAYADMAQSYHLRPGDRALLRGTLHPQTIQLAK